MKALLGTIELLRPSSSLLLFAMLFVPLSIQSHDVVESFERAVPLLLIAMCSFIANDLDDINTDAVNHPRRPLPSRSVSPLVAAVAYFISLAAALAATRATIPKSVAFFYYLTIVMTLSYRYVVAFLSIIKAPYAASVIAIPAVIVGRYNSDSPRFHVVAFAVFAFTLGRELCMDVVDRPGDILSVTHQIKPNAIAALAFLLQIVSLTLVLRSRSSVDLVAIMVTVSIVILLISAAICWFGLQRHEASVDIMKFQLLLGLYYLV